MRPEAEASGYLEARASAEADPYGMTDRKAKAKQKQKQDKGKGNNSKNQYRGPSLRSRMTGFWAGSERARATARARANTGVLRFAQG